MIIRKAKIEDIEQILKLYEELYDTEKVFDLNIREKFDELGKQRALTEKRIRARKVTFLVAEENHKIIGLVDGYVMDNVHYTEKVGYLDHLCVSSNYRKQGIGSALISEFSNIMKKKNVQYLKLNAFAQNTPAVDLYKEIGFEEYSVYYQKKI